MNRFGIQAGDAIGSYRVIEEAGRGGMATVLMVEDQRDQAVRALKILMPTSQDEESQARRRVSCSLESFHRTSLRSLVKEA